MSRPFFSFVCTTYNSESTIVNSLMSVLKQPFVDFEIIVVDDGSIDSTVDVVCGIRDKRIKVFRQLNKGPLIARQYGLSKCSGRYILFLDSDDEYTSDSANLLHKFIRENNYPDIVIYDIIVTTKKSSFIKTSIDNHLGADLSIKEARRALLNNKINALYHKCVSNSIVELNNIDYSKINGFIEEDLIMSLPLFDNACSFFYFKQPLYKYVIRENSLFNSNVVLSLEKRINNKSTDLLLYYAKKWNLVECEKEIYATKFKTILSELRKIYKHFCWKDIKDYITNNDIFLLVNKEAKTKILDSNLTKKEENELLLILNRHFSKLFFIYIFYRIKYIIFRR